MSADRFSASLPRARAVSGTTILGQVLFLVAVALGFMTLGTSIGRELDPGTARICSFAGLGMLIVTWFVPALRRGPVGMAWMFGYALLVGLGLGPVIAYLATVQPSALTSAVAITALTVFGMGALGYALDKDLRGWMRPLSFIVLGAIVVSLVGLIFGGLGALSPFISLLILGASALLILVDFNYVRKHATEDDVVWLATGIFVSIVNIFLSLLNLLSSD